MTLARPARPSSHSSEGSIRQARQRLECQASPPGSAGPGAHPAGWLCPGASLAGDGVLVWAQCPSPLPGPQLYNRSAVPADDRRSQPSHTSASESQRSWGPAGWSVRGAASRSS